MNRDDVIPPSPPVKLDKLKGRSKHRNSLHQKKRSRSILSLRAKNREQSNGNGNDATSISSSAEMVDKLTTLEMNEVDIYAGLAETSADDKLRTQFLLNGFDILGQSKLIEQCNRFDLSQRQEVKNDCVTQDFSQTRGLISLRELVSSQNVHFDEHSASEIESHLPNVRNCSVDEANIQFSEWPLLDELSRPATNTGENTQNNSHLPLIVQNILNDFDEDISSELPIAQSPPLILKRIAKRKTYERTHHETFKTLLFDDDENQEKLSDDGRGRCDISGSQCTQNVDIDIDLNASRRIVENLTSLSTFFTQPKSYELDFNADLSHTIPDFEKRFDEFLSDSDDFRNIRLKTSCDDEVMNNALFDTQNQSKEDSIQRQPTHTELLDFEHDLFDNFDTPKSVHRLPEGHRNSLANSTPHSSAKVRVEVSAMHLTPSTSKQVISSEQRVPKRLRFGTEAEQIVSNAGFSTAAVFQPATGKMPGFSKAGGGAVCISNELLKRAAKKFADVDKEYGHIPTSDESPNPKRIKHVENDSMETPNRNCNSNRLDFKNTKVSETAEMSKARNLFGEDFSDLGCNQLACEFKPAIAGPSNPNMFRNGFTTSRGQAITITTSNLQKYGQMMKEVDKSVCNEFGVDEEEETSVFDENSLACQTPLAKLKNQTRAFATSTPNPNSTIGFKTASIAPITPINRVTPAKFETDNSKLAELLICNDPDELNGCFESSTQEAFTSEYGGRNTSVKLNDTITSDIQPINDSMTEKGIDVLNVAESVKIERRNALIEQVADSFKKPSPIRPALGWLFVHKILKSMKLDELGTPKKYRSDELERLGVQPIVIDLNIDNALQFKFDMWHFYPLEVCQTNVEGIDLHDDIRLIMDENSRAGLKELTSAFLQCPSVDQKLVPDHWIKNALKWIIIKLASYERSFPMKFAGKCLTPENVLAQLKFRYEKEIDKIQRSAIRRIVEKDDTAAKRMVLFVSRILQNGSVPYLELSDGWYGIRTSCLDVVLSKAIRNGKIKVGTKLVIQGAELVGMEEGCTPLEMPSSVALNISANSTRRARWYAKLGYCKDASPFTVSLNSIYGNGGVITRTKAFVLRVYPLVFVVKEKTTDGQRTIFRSNKVEQRQGKKDDKKQFEIIEKFYSDANDQIEKEYEKQRKMRKRSKRKLCDMDDGEELWNFMENSNDGISMEADLTPTQTKLLSDYQTKFYDEKQNKIATLVREKLSTFGSPAKSTALQKVRLIDATSPDPLKTAILSIWNVNDSHIGVRENTFLDLRNVTANGMRGRDVQIMASSISALRDVHSMRSTVHEAYKRRLIFLSEIDPHHFKPHFNEFDTMGIVLKIDEPIPSQFQCVFIADAMKNILCIKFWGSVEQFAYDDIVQQRKFIVISHLEWRTFNRVTQNGIPQAFVTEITMVTECPKLAERAAALNVLKEQFAQVELDIYFDECLDKLTQNVHANKENATMNMESKPLELTANQSMLSRTAPASSATSKPVLGVQQKIDRLRYYGSPPPLKSSYLQSKQHNQTGSRKPFKNPARQGTTDS